MDRDEYNEIINGDNTYREIRTRLEKGEPIIIGWTDQNYTHLDILFTPCPYKEASNSLQHGLRAWYMYVSIIGHGAFGFNTDSAKTPGYVEEKINIHGETIKKFTELLNGVINYGRYYKEV